MNRARDALAYAMLAMAAVMPRAAVSGVAGCVARLETHLTRRGRSAVAEAGWTMQAPAAQRRALAATWLSQATMDLVDFRLVASRPGELATWRVEQRAFEPVAEHLATGRGLVVCIGHFGAANLAIAAASAGTEGTILMHPTDGSRLDFKAAALQASATARLGAAGVQATGQQTELCRLVRRVASAGHVLVIAIDAPFHGSQRSLHRPFLGFRQRSFDIGAARVSRLAQAPIVLCVPERLGPRHCLLHWGQLHQAAPIGRRDLDAEVMNAQLDLLEREIGRLRHQYPYPVGWERRWDHNAAAWIERDERPAAPRPLAPPVVPPSMDVGRPQQRP